ncbi:nitrogen regulation protein NR(II) [Aliikangiella sp. IMCC44632]
MDFSPSLDSLGTALLVLDKQFHIIYLNQSAAQLLGYSGRVVREESFFDLVKSELDENLLKQFDNSQNIIFLEEIELKTARGIINSNIMLSKYSAQNGSGNAHLLLEFQSSEHHSNIRKDIELQQQSRVSNHLIRNLAHEIKNPLGGIKGAAQLMQRKLPDSFPDKYTNIIIQESERLSDLVSRLLLPAEPEELVQVNCHLIIEKALELVLLQNHSEIHIVKDYDPSLPDLSIAPSQIQQALLNLIKNAMEAVTSDAKITLRTRIVHQHTIGKIQHRQVVRIDVIDNGCGIPKHLIKDIFFPTISAKNSSGLGLSIAQSLAGHHGGIIEVESQPGNTCFSLYLPVEKPHAGK